MELDSIIGKTEKEGIEYLQVNNVNFRIVRNNLEYYIITCDYVPDRVNLEIDNDVITSYNNE
jgi:hypothetical protein